MEFNLAVLMATGLWLADQGKLVVFERFQNTYSGSYFLLCGAAPHVEGRP